MENAFAFDWMFDILSLGTAHLYRKYMVGAMVAVEEGLWRRLGGTCGDNAAESFLFQTFDEAYPDLIPTERLRLRGHWSFFVERQDSDIGHEDRGLRTQIPELDRPATNHARLPEAKGLHHLLPASGEAAIRLASCSPDVCPPPHSLGEVGSEKDVFLRASVERSKDLCPADIHDMIAGQPITQNASIAEQPVREDEILSEYCILDEDNDLLQALQRDRRNLILDSVYPHLAPHIVVTPPEYIWEDYFIPFQNRVDPQWHNYLTVPPQTWHAPSSAYMLRSRDHTRFKNSPAVEANCTTMTEEKPCRVFSHEEFAESVLMASDEEVVCPDLVTALQRHQAKANAFHVSRKAPWFRRRYDSPAFVSSIERPFKWTDPGEAMLSSLRQFRGTTVIDSIAPFNVPHIVISEPPPQNPWVSSGNHPNNPQDCLWGARLTVPAKFITFVNPPPCNTEDIESEPDSDYDDDDEEHAEFVDYVALGLASSRPETPAPELPLTADGRREAHVVEEPILDEGREFASFLGESSLSLNDEVAPALPCDEMPRIDYEILDDDEEDDLPPFDDWYISVQSRMQAS